MEKPNKLDQKELTEINGGIVPVFFGAYILGTIGVAIISDIVINWDGYINAINKGFNDGYSSSRNRK